MAGEKLTPKPTAFTGDYSRFSFDPAQKYVMLLKEKSSLARPVPLLDDELNFMQQALLSQLRASFASITGDGSPDNGFQIVGTGANNDFTIKAGTFRIDGWQLVLDADTTYIGQSGEPVLNAPSVPRPDEVYLEVWTVEVNSVAVPGIKDPTLNIQTSTRLQLNWMVKVAEGLVTPASGLDGNNVYRWRCKLATIDRTATAAISAAKVTDARPKNKVWHSGNDGDGSALDADTLDGKHYTDLLPVVVTGSIIASANSYAVGETLSTGKATLPGGVILQWGVTPNIPAYTLSEPVTFDPPFPSQCFFVTASPYYDTSGDMVSTHSVTKTGFKCANRGNGPGDGLTICRYFAIGY